MGGRSKLEKKTLGAAYAAGGSISYALLRLCCYEKAPGSGAARAAISRSARRLAALGLVRRHRGGITITKRGEALVKEMLAPPLLHAHLATIIRKVKQSKRIDDKTMRWAAAYLLLAAKDIDKPQILTENLFWALKENL